MTIWTTDKSASTTQAGNVPKTRVTTVTFVGRGLMPNSRYTFWVNGVDMTWACRTTGTKLGGGLLSDGTGTLTVLYSCEIVPDYTTGGTSGGVTKYQTMELRNIQGNVKARSVNQQVLIQK
jgi:hypothetical protein